MNENEQGKGVQAYFLYIRSVKKTAWFFKQQTEFFLISCLAVAKSFSVLSLGGFLLKRHNVYFFIQRLLWPCKYFYCHCIYDCLKKQPFIFWVYEKTILFSLFTHRFFIQKFVSTAEHVLREVVTQQNESTLRGVGRGSKISCFDQI